MEDRPIIITKGLCRDFKQNRAVDHLDLEIYPGEIFGLIGPDGAGKTTILRLLAGLLSITEGEGVLNGFDLARESEAVKSSIGYMAQQFSLYGELSVTENLAFFAEIYSVPPEEREERMEKLLSFAGLEEFSNRRAAHLSGGMQKKLALACTLVHEPKILLLDEPTTGVDPVSRRAFWNILTDLHIQGTTIVVSTPYMDEADRCSRVGLVYTGKMVICDSPKTIRNQIKGDIVEIVPGDWRETRSVIQQLAGVLEVQTYGEVLHVIVDSGPKRLQEMERAMKKAKLDFKSIRIAPPRMEQAFISLIRDLGQ